MATTRKSVLQILLGSFALTVAQTFPLVTVINSQALGSLHGDTMKHLWTLWWMQRSIVWHRTVPYETLFVNFPVGLNLWPIEPLNGLAAIPLWAVNTTTVSNLLAMGNLTLTGAFGALLGWELTGSRRGALSAGFLLQTSSFAVFTMQLGVGELQHLWLLPLSFWCVLRLVRTRRWRWVPATALALMLSLLGSFYLGLFAAIGALALGLAGVAQSPQRGRTFLQLALAATLLMAVSAKPVQMFIESYGASERTLASSSSEMRDPTEQETGDPADARVWPLQLVWNTQDPDAEDAHKHRAYGGGRLLGLPLLVLAAIGVRKNWRDSGSWIALAAVGVLLSMGSFLTVDGTLWEWNEQRLRLPFGMLNQWLDSWGEPIHFPNRFLALSTVALVCLSASGAVALSHTRPLLATLLVLGNAVDVLVRQVVPFPIERTVLPDLSPLEAVADHSGHGMVDLSTVWRPDDLNRNRFMAAQIVHNHPSNVVPIERLDYVARDGLTLVAALYLTEHLDPAYQGFDDVLKKMQPSRFGEPNGYRSDFAILRQAGFHEILVTYPTDILGEPIPPTLAAQLRQILGPPLIDREDLMLFEIPEVSFSDEEHQQWYWEYDGRMKLVNELGGLEVRMAQPKQTEGPSMGIVPPPPPMPAYVPAE